MLAALRLFLVFFFALPVVAHAVPFIDVQHETGETAFFFAPNFTGTNHAFDYVTNQKFSGTGSVKLNYAAQCQTITTANQCGGSASYTFPTQLSEIYFRQYFFMTGAAIHGATNITSDGKFHVALAYTKMLKIEGSTNPGPRTWLTMGQSGSKNLKWNLENNPSIGRTRVINTNVTFQDNRWYCLEGQLKLNTPGQANGIANMWVDNAFAGGASDVLFIHSTIPTTTKWGHASIFRQIGEGNIFYDRTAFATHRIGCLGQAPPQDTTPPNPFTNLQAQ